MKTTRTELQNAIDDAKAATVTCKPRAYMPWETQSPRVNYCWRMNLLSFQKPNMKNNFRVKYHFVHHHNGLPLLNLRQVTSVTLEWLSSNTIQHTNTVIYWHTRARWKTMRSFRRWSLLQLTPSVTLRAFAKHTISNEISFHQEHLRALCPGIRGTSGSNTIS